MQEEGLSLLAQSNRLQDYADRKGLEVIKTFEIVESSTHGERKQFMEMINFCKNRGKPLLLLPIRLIEFREALRKVFCLMS